MSCHCCGASMDAPSLSVACDAALLSVQPGWKHEPCGDNANLCRDCAFVAMVNELGRRWRTTSKDTATRILAHDGADLDTVH